MISINFFLSLYNRYSSIRTTSTEIVVCRTDEPKRNKKSRSIIYYGDIMNGIIRFCGMLFIATLAVVALSVAQQEKQNLQAHASVHQEMTKECADDSCRPECPMKSDSSKQCCAEIKKGCIHEKGMADCCKEMKADSCNKNMKTKECEKHSEKMKQASMKKSGNCPMTDSTKVRECPKEKKADK